MDTPLAQGAHNLLVNCADLQAGASVVVIHEDPAFGWYDLEAPNAVANMARSMGAAVTMLPVGAPSNAPNQAAVQAVADHDVTVFFSRIGDQDRFEASPAGKTVVMCYARDASLLASSYGRADHRAFLAMKAAVNETLFGATEVRVTCALGTNMSGHATLDDLEPGGDVGVRRFPMGVHQPLKAKRFSGRLALANYLTPTGSRVYEPASIELEAPVFTDIANGSWERLEGPAKVIQRFEAHHQTVAETFDIDAKSIDSWHAGIHPGCLFTRKAADDPDYWSNSIFTNPRFLHFHTCGNGPPGEICWMIQDPTVSVDGVALWENGSLHPERMERTKAVLDQWPELPALFATPERGIGL